MSNRYFYEPHEVSLCDIHVTPKCLLLFLSGIRGEGKSDNDNGFKIFWATYCSSTIINSVKQTKWNLLG